VNELKTALQSLNQSHLLPQRDDQEMNQSGTLHVVAAADSRDAVVRTPSDSGPAIPLFADEYLA